MKDINSNLYPQDAYILDNNQEKFEKQNQFGLSMEKLLPLLNGGVSTNDIIGLLSKNNPKLMQIMGLFQNINKPKNIKKITASTCDYISVKEYYKNN